MITSRLNDAALGEAEPVRAAAFVDAVPAIAHQVAPRRVSYAFAKRFLDIIFASVFLAIFALPLLLVALLVKLTSRGPAFYVSERVGLGGQRFKFYKFRTMRVDAEEQLHELLAHNEKDGPIFKMEQDPRVTPIGAFLRKSSLDEVPQMIHVLTGKMTLVGPRPPVPREVEFYSCEEWQRLSVKPGLTCYWQIQGRSDLDFETWMELDRKYIEEMSFWTDLKILAKTPIAVLSGRGAY
jgi:lipopolysaccharide/colanic/teichoic acid biosynthesis glycosyltransferase